jgi:hypothetical protein
MVLTPPLNNANSHVPWLTVAARISPSPRGRSGSGQQHRPQDRALSPSPASRRPLWTRTGGRPSRTSSARAGRVSAPAPRASPSLQARAARRTVPGALSQQPSPPLYRYSSPSPRRAALVSSPSRWCPALPGLGAPAPHVVAAAASAGRAQPRNAAAGATATAGLAD